MERRNFLIQEMRIKKEENEPEKIVGYAAVFNSLSEDLGGFREIIRPNAFFNAIKTDDVRALWNHDPNFVLGRNKSGTLQLEEDERGLKIEITPPDTQWSRDLMESMRRGDVDQMSFGFTCVSDKWGTEQEQTIRELLEVRLFDVSPVTYPAYQATTVGVRSTQDIYKDYLSTIEQGLNENKNEDEVRQVSMLRKKLELKSKEV